MKPNPYSDFIETCLEKRPGFGIKKQELWDKYIEYNKGKIPNIIRLKFHKIISEVLGSPIRQPFLSKEYFNEIGIDYPLYGRFIAHSVYKDWYFSSDPNNHICLKGSKVDFSDTNQIKQVKLSIRLRSDHIITNYNQDKEKHTQAPIILKEIQTKGEIKKRKTIPKRVREQVWKTYINTLESQCLVCDGKLITAFDFECGHVDANGPAFVENLRPICRSCNGSMGRQHMKEFAASYFPNAKVLSTF